jgi:hypothetical protein
MQKVSAPKTREYSRFSLDNVFRTNYWMNIIQIKSI